MQIQNYCTYSSINKPEKQKNFAFKSFYIPVKKQILPNRNPFIQEEKFLSEPNTCFFRDDLNWNSFLTFLDNKYKSAKKVNFINLACSNGSESFSLVMALLSKFGEKAKKFFPIKASDIDEKILEFPQNGKIFMDKHELHRIIDFIGEKSFLETISITDKNFQFIDNYNEFSPNCKGEINKHIRDNIKFEVRDASKDLPDISKNNTVIFARNFWPYLSQMKQLTLASNITNNTGKNSTVVIGNFDYNHSCISDYLLTHGFEDTLENLCYEKK